MKIDIGSFEGCYFKLEKNKTALALIPAIHCHGGEIQKASLQVVTPENIFVRHFSFTVASYQRNPLVIRLGKNRFSKSGIYLEELGENFSLTGKLRFTHMLEPQKNIMGPFAKIPFMECYHSLFSLKHRVTGSLELNGEQMDFNRGFGYIEGDRGRSFPKEYLWTHSFFSSQAQTGSIMLAVAEIPVPWGTFTGIIGFVFWKGTEHRFATYYGAKVVERGVNSVTIQQGSYKLTAIFLEKKSPQMLHAPQSGMMNRTIKECLQGVARYQFFQNNQLLLDITTEKASFELEYS